MDLTTFFEKFDQFAGAPNAVAKMQELVLELAIRGHLIQSGKSLVSEELGTSEPFRIPVHWSWHPLNEVAGCRASAKVSPTCISDIDWVLDLEDIDPRLS